MNATASPNRPAMVGTSVLCVGLGAVMLAGFLSLPRAQAISSLPWKAELVAGLFCVVLAVFALRMGRTRTLPQSAKTIIWFGAAFILWSGASALWAASFGWTLHHTLTWAVYLAVFGMLVTADRGKLRTGTATAFAVIATILAVNAVVDLATIPDFFADQGAIRIRYGKFAEMVLTFTPLLCVAAWYAKGRTKIVFSAAWLAAWLLVMLSLSKGAFLAGIAGHIVLFGGCFFLGRRMFRRPLVRYAVIWLVFTIVIQGGFSILGTIPSTTDYITGAADKTRETSVFRTFTWKVGLAMARSHPVLGVGADNFGIAFNEARAGWAQDQHLAGPEMAEDYVVERAHNEFLQIVDELGIVGIVLIAGMAAAFAFYSYREMRRRRRLSPAFWAAVGGMAGFIASSMVSSFSFRAIQNGIVFFVVLAIAVREVPASGRKTSTASKWKLVAAAVGILMTVFAGSKAIGEYQVYRAERTADLNAASSLYDSALTIDPDNAPAYYYLAHRVAVQSKNYHVAALILKEGIDRGVGMTLTYSKLSTYYEQAGDMAAAKDALEDAIRIFPRSVFARVRYSDLLRRTGDEDGAAREMAAASAIDARQAAGWQAILRDGSVNAFLLSQKDPQISAPDELMPARAVPEYVDSNPLSAK
jgi:O-antigen ligase